MDNVSEEMLRGAKLDYQDELISAGFRMIEIPKAESTCGCGTSINLKL